MGQRLDVTALAVSLALSVSLTPVLARRLRRGAGQAGRSPGRRLYLALLDRSLAHPWAVIVAAVVLLGAGLGLLPILPRELVPPGPARVLAVEYRLPPGLSREEARRRVSSLEHLGAGSGAAATLSLYRGREEEELIAGEVTEWGELELVFADAASLGRARDDLAAALRGLPGFEAELRIRRSAVAAALERSSRRIEIEVLAASPARAADLGARVAAHLAAAGLRAETAAEGRVEPSFVVDWDLFRLGQLEADPDALPAQVRAGLGGLDVGRVEVDGVEPEILVETTRPVDPRLLPVRPRPPDEETGSAEPEVVPLAAVAAIERRLEPPVLERRNGRPAVRLLLAAGDQTPPSRVAALLAELPRAVDEGVRLSGQAHELRRSFAQLRLALVLALVLVFLTVAALYESLTMPLVVMTTVPVAAAGALGILQLTSQSLNVMSFLGLILLAGIVVNNAIVLIHRIEQLHAAGRAPLVAVREAAGERYRPILMTTLTTLLGMIPLAVLAGEGLELRRALAVAVCGGLVTSLFAALFVVPVLHRALVRRGSLRRMSPS